MEQYSNHKYSLGKIKNKYIIFNVIGYVGYDQDIIKYLTSASIQLRQMTIENYKNGFEQYITRYEIKEIRVPEDTSLLIDDSFIQHEKQLNIALSSYKRKHIDLIEKCLSN